MRLLGTALLTLALLATGPAASARQLQPDSFGRAAAVPTATLVTVGDIACPPGKTVTPRTCQQKATAQAATSLRPNRVLVLGDLQYEVGSYSAFVSSYGPSWGTLKRITWPVPGNHEYDTPGARGYYRYFSGQTVAPGHLRRSLNGWQVFVVNSNCNKVDCRAERIWLQRSLAAHPSRCAILAMHHPRYSSGLEHGSSPAMAGFWRIAQRAGVDLVLSGHDHDYERFRRMNADGRADANGMQQFVVGTGGKSLYSRGKQAPGSLTFLSSTFGVLQLTLRPTGFSWAFRDTALKVRDSGSGSCRA